MAEMKINYKNTALGVITKPDIYDFAFPPDMISNGRSLSKGECINFGLSILSKSASLNHLVSKNVQLVRRPFWEAYAKSCEKLKKVMLEVNVEEGGVLILEGTPFTHTYYYYIRTFGEGENWDYDLLFMDFSKLPNNDEPHLDVFVSREAKSDSNKTLIWKNHLDKGMNRNYWLLLILGFVVFKNYCDIETVEVEGGRKVKTKNDKYVNETKSNIKVLDCTWFTNLVRTGAFMVGDETGGFLRWQHYGPGKSQKKLIWIDPFEKQGYTRKAKILNQ